MKRALLVAVATTFACGGGSRIGPLSSTTSAGDQDAAKPADDDGAEKEEDTETDRPVDDDPIVIAEADDPTFGDACASTAECGPGLVCSGLVLGSTICTVPCVGSGKGGNDDCPAGYACFNYESTTLDGLQICLAAWQLGASYAGYPFTTPPGGTCTASDNACQTQVCNLASGSCVVQCAADRDCAADEVCYAYPGEGGNLHICFPSDLDSYLPTGSACDESAACDTGMCAEGACVSHCRSTTDCASDAVCAFWPLLQNNGYAGWTSVCLARSYNGRGGLGDACDSDADCASEWCLEGMCTTPCATRDDCDALMPSTECIQLNFADSSAAFSGGFCLLR